MTPDSPQAAIERINAAEGTHYTVGEQYSGGEDQGAYQAVGANGHHAVLKLSRNPLWANQVRRGKAATDRLAGLGYPVPRYTTIDSSDFGSYWLETELPGSTATGNPTTAQITDLLRLIDLQKDQAISEVQGQDWVWYITEVVFRGTDGHVRVLMKFSPDTSAIAYAAEGLVAGLGGKMLPKTDLVHGDMNLGQVLFAGDKVSGVLDWDQAGYGDRTVDLVGLWYSILGATEQRDLVMAHMLQISDRDAIKIYAVHKILSQLAWHINKVHGNVAEQVVQANTAIEQLKLI